MTPMINDIANYVATDPDGLGMEPDSTGAPALLGGVRRRWPQATDAQIAMAVQAAINLAEKMAQECFAEADALDRLYEAKTGRRTGALTADRGGDSE